MLRAASKSSARSDRIFAYWQRRASESVALALELELLAAAAKAKR